MSEEHRDFLWPQEEWFIQPGMYFLMVTREMLFRDNVQTWPLSADSSLPIPLMSTTIVLG